jgi:hypothetical protein
MPRWVCPNCDREFARAHQSHVCVPGGTEEESFRGRPPEQYQMYRAIMAHLESLGPFHVDAVGVGVFLKSDRKFAEIRPMARALAIWIGLPYRIDDPRLGRAEAAGPDRFWNRVRLSTMEQLDDDVFRWLTDAYDDATD